MFGAVASLIVISNALDDCPYLTLAEKIHYAGMIFIFLSVLESSISLKLYHAGKETCLAGHGRHFDLSVSALFSSLQ